MTQGNGDQRGDDAGSQAKQFRTHANRYVLEASKRVPHAGDGNRWYDRLFKIIESLWMSRFVRRLPARFRESLTVLYDRLLQLNDLERERAWSLDDPSHNLRVSNGEQVTIPSIWVAEVFPPSEAGALDEQIERNGWDKKRAEYGLGESNQEILRRSRSEAGWSWWRLGAIVNTSSNWVSLDGPKQKLPTQFETIELMARQVGHGLTVVIAHFRLSVEGRQQVNNVWHAKHEPRMVRGRGRPRAEGRLWVGFRDTQTSRRELHDLAREWMCSACAGAFVRGGVQQPLMDLLLLEQHDPSLGDQVRPPLRDALRALGVDGFGAYLTTAGQLPGLVFEHVDTQLCPILKGEHTWTLWGRTERITAAVGDVGVYGGELYGAISHVVDKGIQRFFAGLAISDFLSLKQRQNALLRDTARAQHGKFGRRELRKLRDDFLTGSLDINTIPRDIKIFTSRRPRYTNDAIFKRQIAPWATVPSEEKALGVIADLKERLSGKGGRHRDRAEIEVNMNDELDIQLVESSEALVAFDSDYRDILSTVATLGASIDAFKVQRYVLWVTVVSVVVALMAVVIAVVGVDKTDHIITAVRHWMHI